MNDAEQHAAKAAAEDARAKQSAIRALNDAFRRSLRGGRAMMTAGVAALEPKYVLRAWRAVKRFETFDADNDPHGEHDFGAFELEGMRFFWKIDYYDNNIRYSSRDPADPQVTARVLTLMLASEY